MRISFSPQRRDDALSVSKVGDALTINGTTFDFGALSEGGTIPAGAIPCEWVVGPVERIDGELHLTLILPHGPNPHHAVTHPQSVTVAGDGQINLPRGSNVDA